MNPEARRTFFDAEYGPELVAHGKKMAKKRNPVYLEKMTGPFEVQTNEGLMSGQPGDFIAHDPISGHVWPVSAAYVSLHYEDY